MSFSTAIRSELCLISVLGDFISTINRKSRIVSFFGAIQMFGFKIRLISVRFARICITVGLVCAALACDSTHFLKSPTAKSDVVTDIVSGISRALADQRSKLLSDIRYQVSLNLPANKLMGITGHSVIKFKWKADQTDFLVLDFKDPRENVKSLKLNGAKVSWELRFDHILIQEEELRDGFNEISIDYLVGSGGLNRDDNFFNFLSKKAKHKNIKIISDGGIKYSGDLAKAFAAGADAVMIGSLFAGTDETPGKLIKKNGKLFKSFRGMGSVGAMNKGSADRYFQTKQKDSSKYVPEGVEGFVKYKGDVGSIVYKLIGGLKSSMGYLGSKNIIKLRNKPNFVKITKAGFYESMVHNVDVVKNDSKY